MFVLEITPQGCGEMFSDFGTPTTNVNIILDSPQAISLMVFTGGEDVCPELYDETAHRSTYYNLARDMRESKIFDLALKHKIPMVGICRGGQFLCVKAGHKLIQHLNGHGGSHVMHTNGGRDITCTSTHHQMQLPGKGAIPLAWAEPRLSNVYLNGNNDNVQVEHEYEVVYYPNIRAIGIQGHPEYLNEGHEFVKYSKEIVKKYLEI